MKFSIVKVTSDDEYARYLVTFETPNFFSFYCSDADREMMINSLNMEKKPHPQKIVKGCPCAGLSTCQECADRHIALIKKLNEKRLSK